MDLKLYMALHLKTEPKKEAFAARCDTALGQLKQVAFGHRRANPSLAINIERESGGLVKCETLRPDVDWEYIRSTGEQAPLLA